MARQKFYIVLLAGSALFASALGTFSFFEEPSPAPLPISSYGEVQRPDGVEGDRTGSNVLIQALLLAPGVSYNVMVQHGSNVFELMKAAEDSGFRFRGKHFPGLGFFIEEINGLAQNPKEGRYWIYYIDGERAPVGVSQYIVQPNDVIEWKYEASQ